MRDLNPYKILQVPRNADVEAIEDAYDRLFDKFEPRAQAGDKAAIRTLEELNEAHDVLVDPDRRAELDARLAEQQAVKQPSAKQPVARPPVAQPQAPSTRAATQTVEAATRPKPRAQAAARPATNRAKQPAPQTTRSAKSTGGRRAAAAPPRAFPPVALILGGVLLFLVVIVAVFLVSRGSGGTTNAPVATQAPIVNSLPTGTAAVEAIQTQGIDLSTIPTPSSLGGSSTKDPNQVVATVDGQPIYMRDYVVRDVKDVLIAQTDPMMGPLIASMGVTGTRMLDIIDQDALDKLINMQVIVQQAKKEGVYPSPDQASGLVEQAKQHDLNGVAYDQFLKKNNLTDQQYQDNVVRNVVYALMASKHIPQAGTADDKQNAFIEWICTTRKQYDVKVMLSFKEPNQPCTSGLPSDVPLSDVPPNGTGGTQVPQPEATGPTNP